MIIYDLSCENEHRFEGWFRGADDFRTQLERGLIRCPHCDSGQVSRRPSRIAIGTQISADTPKANVLSAHSISAHAHTPSPSMTQMMGMYREFVDTLQRHSEDVGDDFANEARRIQAGDAPQRLIRGQTTPEERKELRDEGIGVLTLPIIRNEDLN